MAHDCMKRHKLRHQHNSIEKNGGVVAAKPATRSCRIHYEGGRLGLIMKRQPSCGA